MKQATVVVNHCNCHPETCGCDDWLVLDRDGHKFDTFYLKASADRAAQLLNENDVLREKINKLKSNA